MPSLLAIDPGLQGTGVAIWNSKSDVPFLASVVTGRGAAGDEWIDRAFRIAMQVQELAFEHNVRHVICEMMEMHQSARAQMMWKAGDFQRTLVLIGIIFGMLEPCVVSFVVAPPSQWKGQLPKSVTIRRVQRAIGAKACARLGIEKHAWDAVGLGLWHKGVIK